MVIIGANRADIRSESEKAGTGKQKMIEKVNILGVEINAIRMDDAISNSEDLAAKVEWAFMYPNKMMKMGQEARQEYERKYTVKQNYQMLMDIYQMAIKLKK